METSQRTTRDSPTKTHCFTAVAEDAKPQYTSTSASVAVRPPRGISADVEDRLRDVGPNNKT
ncbi:hypothetical protein CH063_14208 [Colletotrichum higginsianum]|uniref:Uncharacterized protein n=1 Tax=Colletotrichum higginsianum (strain IMI 349063) TaxID=759273 RepID=H1VXL1_COLHI|nr:hypothetical protein CH063_14208 [Colletotrichum higginsianum]